MTQDEIIQVARQAGWTGIFSQWVSPTERQHLTVPVTIEQIEAFAKLVAEAEREACAKVLDEMATQDKLSNYYAVAAKAIRDRKQA